MVILSALDRKTVGLLACIALASGCTTLSSDRWGEGATLRPGWDRVLDAAQSAALDPRVWAPLAGAAVLQIDHFDRRTSDWAREHTPLFGSSDNADSWSDDLRTASIAIDVGTMLAAPSGAEPSEWFANKAKGALVEAGAIGATSLTTAALKKGIGRRRPNMQDDESFPSGHASMTAVNARLTSFNLQSMDLDPRWQRAADITLDALTYAEAWSRVESGWHYPSDTLAAIALGNFFATFFNHAFLDAESHAALSVSMADGNAMLSWRMRF